MATIAQALDAAVKHHQGGNLGEAERLYREILDRDPRNADAWHLLGLVSIARDQFEDALMHIGKAIELDPKQAVFHNHLAEAYRSLDRLDQAEHGCRLAIGLKPDFAIAHNTLGTVLDAKRDGQQAIASYRRAIALKPDFAQAHYNLGLALESQGQLPDAQASYREALLVQPDYALALHRLGVVWQQQSRLNEAIDCFRRSLALMPDHSAAHCNLGTALKDQGRAMEAIESYRRALALDPKLTEAYFNLAVIYQTLRRFEDAEEAYRRCLRIYPRWAEAFNNLGSLLRLQGKLSEAIHCYQQALEFRPDFAEVLSNLGNVFTMQGRRAEAMVCYDQSLRMRPDHAQGHANRAMVRLAEGNFAEGWSEFEWRWKCDDFPKHGHATPQWDGSRLGDRTLLVHAEQGLGDTLQFVRYVRMLQARGDKVVVEVQPSLVRLLEQSGFRGVVARGAPLPHCDVRIGLMSLPGIFGTDLDSIPADVPYLSVDAKIIGQWRDTLGDARKFSVGLVWQGSQTHRKDRFRSIPLARFAPLALENVELVSLQKGPGCDQLAGVTDRFRIRDFGDALDSDCGSFVNIAAIMKILDLVITVDTATAHLAGGLGVPVWVAVPFAPDWRWQYDREDCPWYPTLRLFRQTIFDDWSAVFEHLTAELRRAVDEAGK